MIARDSKSYPYLAIAQHYGVSYGEVLAYAETKAKLKQDHPYVEQWKLEVYKIVQCNIK